MSEIAFIMGKSASGKDSIYKRLKEQCASQLHTVVLYTTRPMREGEQEGVEYHFVTDAVAEELERTGKVVEMRSYNTVYGIWKYFTAADGQIDLASGQRYLVIGTLEAYEQFCKYYGKEHMLPIYIEVDDGVRLQRALDREKQQKNPKYAEMCRRFLADEQDFSEENLKKNQICKRFSNNGNIEECIERIIQEIEAQM